MHRGVSENLRTGRYCAAIDAALSWLNCTSYAQLAQELAALPSDEQPPLQALLRDSLLLGGPLGGPLWGVPLLLSVASPCVREVVLLPPTTLAAGLVRSGWLPVGVLESDEPLGFACKPASLGVAAGVVTAVVLVVQSDDTEPPEVDEACIAASIKLTPACRLQLSAGPLSSWIEAAEAARMMLRGALPEKSLAAGGAPAEPLFLCAAAAAKAFAAGRKFAQTLIRE